jgi:hypothetical protein
MRVLTAVLLAVSLAACDRKQAPPATPTAEALGAELATFRQVLVLLSPETMRNLAHAESIRGPGNAVTGDFSEVYGHLESIVGGSTVAVMVAYSGAWLLPKDVVARPMTPTQFLRAFIVNEECARAVVITPRGDLVVSREQVLDVLIETRQAGAVGEDLPFSLIHSATTR